MIYKLLLGLAIAGYGVIVGLPAVQRWRYRRKYPPIPAPDGFVVELEMPGNRAGWLSYREGEREARFGWELGGAGVVVFITVPAPEQWATAVPWAPDRRTEILDRVAREVWRQECRGCTGRVERDTIVFTSGS